MNGAQSRPSGEIPAGKSILMTCNGCGRDYSGNDAEALLAQAISHEIYHHLNGHPEGFTVEIREFHA